jgi:predicted HicB family RNase H-like nuclease
MVKNAPYRTLDRRVTLRLPADVHEALVDLAAGQDMTLNAFLNDVLATVTKPRRRRMQVDKT